MLAVVIKGVLLHNCIWIIIVFILACLCCDEEHNNANLQQGKENNALRSVLKKLQNL